MENNTQPLFSILIANYNNGQYLQECIDSVLAQSYPNWEVVIVDDCSTDGISINIYKKYKNDSRLKIYLNDKNRGCGYTKRRCAELANGEICAFLDPDDAITPDALEVMTEEHCKSRDYSLIYSTHFICNANLEIQATANYVTKIDINESYLSSNSNKVSHFATFKKEKYLKHDGIDPELKKAVDQDLYLKLEETGKIKFINKPLYKYRIHNDGISQFSENLKAQIQFLEIQKKARKRRIKDKTIKAKNISWIVLVNKELTLNNAFALQLFKNGQIKTMYLYLLKNLKFIVFDRQLLTLRMAILPFKKTFPFFENIVIFTV